MSDSLAFRQALSQFATGVAVVTGCDQAGEPMGMTINSFSSVSLNPQLVLWSIDKSAAGYEHYIAANRFAIQVLADSAQATSDLFAQRGIDKFGQAQYMMTDGLPLLTGCTATFICKEYKQVDAGDHTIIIGEVESFSCDPGKPLVFHDGGYTQLT